MLRQYAEEVGSQFSLKDGGMDTSIHGSQLLSCGMKSLQIYYHNQLFNRANNMGPKKDVRLGVILYRGKHSIELPPINFFWDHQKGSQGHVLDQSGPIWPTWNTPKKCFLSRKTPKEDERVAPSHFHERVDERPRRYENFGTNAFTKSRFVSEIRPFEKKVLV